MKLTGIFGIGLYLLHALSSHLFEHKLYLLSAVEMDQIKNCLLVTRVNLLQNPFPVLWSCVTAPSWGVLGTQNKCKGVLISYVMTLHPLKWMKCQPLTCSRVWAGVLPGLLRRRLIEISLFKAVFKQHFLVGQGLSWSLVCFGQTPGKRLSLIQAQP